MDIGFVWDEKKYQTVVKEHNVKFHEVVAAFDEGKYQDEHYQRRNV